ncbi:MAG TPA: hypothetical protein PKY77_18035 [Phycisphaerae bacterium]|nr:hypothetical protein [Phycisphaerae bacterium]HRY70247.1 hypothetical protein [Phycisphaerae bacterium]HSA27582.1 hypothetical protein [Phycisphaerae bacterium]
MTRRLIALTLGVATSLAPSSQAQTFTTVFSDTFDGGVSRSTWPKVEGKINVFPMQYLEGSSTSGHKDHTGNGGQAATEIPNNPFPYAAYHEFEALPQLNILRVGAWIWQDVERPLCTAEAWPVRGMVGLTSLPGEALALPPGPMGPNVVYPYDDFAFIGVEMPVSNNPEDPVQKFYRWRTKTDGWNLSSVPRKADFVCHGAQTWRHVEIVVHPYSGQVGDIEFFIDGQLVGQGHRAPGPDGTGVPLRRIQLGSRFPEEQDATDVRPPYSYEFFWFDDVELSTASPCHEPRADVDGDADVDQVDFGLLQRCYTGPNPITPYDLTACGCLDIDADWTIDATDLNSFSSCYSGPTLRADASCDAGTPLP